MPKADEAMGGEQKAAAQPKRKLASCPGGVGQQGGADVYRAPDLLMDPHDCTLGDPVCLLGSCSVCV